MPSRRREISFVVVVTCASLALLHAADAALDLSLARIMAMRPAELWTALDGGPLDARRGWALATPYTSVLVHGDLGHLTSNLAFFWFFGTLLAQVAGERAVAVALLVTPVSAAAAYLLRHAEVTTPVVGASGAISGVAGLFVLLSVRWEDAPRVQAWPLAFPVPPMQAALIAVASAALDVWVLRSGTDPSVASDAHLGGFAGGLVLGAVLTTFWPTRAAWTRGRSEEA